MGSKAKVDLYGSVNELLLIENPEPFTCLHFGCGRSLSLVERLAGNYCTAHMIRAATDPVKVVRMDFVNRPQSQTVKQQLINSLEITLPDSDISPDILAKFEGFKEWAINQVNKL